MKDERDDLEKYQACSNTLKSSAINQQNINLEMLRRVQSIRYSFLINDPV